MPGWHPAFAFVSPATVLSFLVVHAVRDGDVQVVDSDPPLVGTICIAFEHRKAYRHYHGVADTLSLEVIAVESEVNPFVAPDFAKAVEGSLELTRVLWTVSTDVDDRDAAFAPFNVLCQELNPDVSGISDESAFHPHHVAVLVRKDRIPVAVAGPEPGHVLSEAKCQGPIIKVPIARSCGPRLYALIKPEVVVCHLGGKRL